MKKKGWTKYGIALKTKIVHEYLNSEEGFRDLERKYGVNYTTIYNWVKSYREEQRNAEQVSGKKES